MEMGDICLVFLVHENKPTMFITISINFVICSKFIM